MNLMQVSLLLGILAVVLAAICLWHVTGLRRRLAQVTPDTQHLVRRLKARPDPEALHEIFAHLENLSRRLGQLETEAARLQTSYATTVQKVGLVRFNSDENIRGNLSFALALLDGKDSGVLMASLYSLEGCRIFVRQIDRGQTQHELLPEEQLALARARGLAKEE